MKALKKFLLSSLFLLMPSFAYASSFDSIFEPIEGLLMSVMKIGALEWVTDNLIATKFAIFIIIFALINFILTVGIGGKGNIFGAGGKSGKKVSIVIAFSLAAITVLFIPNNILKAIGNMYSLVFALVLVSVPIGLMLFFAHNFTKDNKNKGIVHGVRFAIALVSISILMAVGVEYGVYPSVGGAGVLNDIFSILFGAIGLWCVYELIRMILGFIDNAKGSTGESVSVDDQKFNNEIGAMLAKLKSSQEELKNKLERVGIR